MCAHMPSLPLSTSRQNADGSPGGRPLARPYSHHTSVSSLGGLPCTSHFDPNSLRVSRKMPPTPSFSHSTSQETEPSASLLGPLQGGGQSWWGHAGEEADGCTAGATRQRTLTCSCETGL